MKSKYCNFSEHQLVMVAYEVGLHDSELNKEWRKRYAMNFPYKLNIRNQIHNCLMDVSVDDEECDRSILDQANHLRERRKNNGSKVNF